jgi:hypothetical protein
MELIKHARARLERSKNALGTFRAQEAETIIDSMERLITTAREQREKLDKDERLSAVGKKEQRDAMRDVLKEGLEEGVARFEQLVAEREAKHREKLKMPPISGEDAQGRLANARADAVLVLDRTPDERLAETFETLARDPGDVGALMLSGFAERYLQARPSNATAAVWNARKDDLLVERLGDEAREARAALASLADARAAATITKHQAIHALQELSGATASSEGNQ